MRIAYVSTYPPNECGIATYTQYLSESVARKGKEIRILGQLGADGENVFEVFAPTDKDIAAKLFFYIERLSPDVVHIEHEFGLFGDQRGVQIVEFLIRCNLADTPVITTLHTVFEDLKYEERIIVQHILNCSSTVVVHEYFQKEILLSTYDCPNPIEVIPHGVRIVETVENAKELLYLEGKKVLLLAGYMRSTKNFEKIISLLPSLVKSIPNFMLLIATRSRINEHSKYGEELYQLIEDSQYQEHIKVLHGKFPQHTLDTILSASDLLALPYTKGAQSGVLAQASALNLPVITSDLQSFKNWIFEVNGGLYAESDDEYVSHISRLLKDDELRYDFMDNIKQSNLERNWNTIAGRHILLYKKVIKSPTSKAEFFHVESTKQHKVNLIT